MHSLIPILSFIILACSEINYYSNHEFFLFKDNKDVLTYDSYNNLFHITNLSFYKEIINIALEVIDLILSQLISARLKMGINELGTV